MSSKENILKKISMLNLIEQPYPDYDFLYPDKEILVEKFFESLKLIGGSGFLVESITHAEEQIKTFAYLKPESKVFSAFKEISIANTNLEDFPEPKKLNDLDLAIVKGEFGVVENGAIWINPENLKHRAVLFACAHLVIVLSKKDLFLNMHQAYQRTDFTKHKTTYFISGPSKTADIEQCLVIGAQGAKSLNVFLL